MIKFDSKAIFSSFNEHLDIKDNVSILFSAPFGTGKTTFLKEYFEEFQNKYNTVHLYPVYYSVAKNEDIFELIKFDILFQLLLNYKNYIQSSDELDFSKSLALQLYLTQNFKPISIFQELATLVSKVGKSLNAVVSTLKKEKESFDDFFNSINTSESAMIENYLLQLQDKAGSIKEVDTITDLIANILERLKINYKEEQDNEGKFKKENVLIIDDLDRIDPEHIFRIFNVLSAHHDWETKRNKFGFDKVVLVCDIDNIKEIYNHRYGVNVDFTGYVNKFYSNGIYNFNNKELIIRRIPDLMRAISPLSKELFNDNKKIKKYHLELTGKEHFPVTIQYLLRAFILSGLLDLRTIINMKKFNIKEFNVYDDETHGRYKTAMDYEFLVLVNFFEQLFGNLHTFKSKLKMLKNTITANPKYLGLEESYYDENWGKWMVSYCLPFWNTENRKKAAEEDTLLHVYYNNFCIEYQIEKYNFYDYYFRFISLKDKNLQVIYPLSEFNLFELMYDTLDKVTKDKIYV